MSEPIPREPWTELQELCRAGDSRRLTRFLEELSGTELALALSRVNQDDRRKVMTAIPSARAAEILEAIPPAQATGLVDDLHVEEAARIVGAMESANQADLLGDLAPAEAAAILFEMDPQDARAAKELLAYAPDTAGGLMKTEFLRFRTDSTIGGVLEDLRANGEAYSDYAIQYGYVVSESGKLLGVLRLRDILFAARGWRVDEAMIRDPLLVPAESGLENLEELFEEHAFVGLPVVDEDGRMLGVVERRAVREAREMQAGETLLKVSGIVGGEEIRSMPLRIRSMRRLSWLSANIVLNVIAASVIAFYEDTLRSVIALAVFLPIISDMSGCSGNQAVTVSIRELALGLVKPNEVRRVLGTELSLGAINGLVLGSFLGGIAFLWKGNPFLGLVVGGALMVNTIISVALGGSLPLLLKRMGRDPALSSAPILTTVTDLLGFLIVLSGATMLLSVVGE
jgi:magnesium transporter